MTSKSRDSRGKVTYMSFGSGENLISKSCGLWKKKHVVYGKENLQNLFIFVNLLGQYLTPFFLLLKNNAFRIFNVIIFRQNICLLLWKHSFYIFLLFQLLH